MNRKMLLAMDISNTNIKFGVYDGQKMQHYWVVSTVRQRTTDEYAMVFQELAVRYCNREPVVINANMHLQMQLLVDNPWEVGTDRLVTTLAAHTLYGGPAIVIAFSSATKFDVVSREGDFFGGAIAPGLVISAEALSNAASQFFRV